MAAGREEVHQRAWLDYTTHSGTPVFINDPSQIHPDLPQISRFVPVSRVRGTPPPSYFKFEYGNPRARSRWMPSSSIIPTTPRHPTMPPGASHRRRSRAQRRGPLKQRLHRHRNPKRAHVTSLPFFFPFPVGATPTTGTSIMIALCISERKKDLRRNYTMKIRHISLHRKFHLQRPSHDSPAPASLLHASQSPARHAPNLHQHLGCPIDHLQSA